MKILDVELGERSYPIYIGEGLLSIEKLFDKHIKGAQLLIVTNTTVAALYLPMLKATLAKVSSGLLIDVVILPDGEQYKNIETLGLVYDQLLKSRHERKTTLIALGGGVIGDITGFAAATYQRGVNFIQIPTTLLSQVDSSVGGKTGINHPLGKNMIGAFYQPQSVVIDTCTLKTLPEREFAAGLAEVIKYGLIMDKSFFDWIEKNMAALLRRDPDALAIAIERSCSNKAVVVAEDEFEADRRAILNFGHTFGHAIENFQGYGSWLHGEAVAAGMIIAAGLSSRLGWLSRQDVDRIVAVIHSAGLPIKVPSSMSVEHFYERMQSDKKVKDGKINFVLLKLVGQAVITSEVSRDLVADAIIACSTN